MSADEAAAALTERAVDAARHTIIYRNYPFSESDFATDLGAIVEALLSARGPCATCGGTHVYQEEGLAPREGGCPDCFDGQGPLLVLQALGGIPSGYCHPRQTGIAPYVATWDRKNDSDMALWRFPVVATSEEAQ